MTVLSNTVNEILEYERELLFLCCNVKYSDIRVQWRQQTPFCRGCTPCQTRYKREKVPAPFCTVSVVICNYSKQDIFHVKSLCKLFCYMWLFSPKLNYWLIPENYLVTFQWQISLFCSDWSYIIQMSLVGNFIGFQSLIWCDRVSQVFYIVLSNYDSLDVIILYFWIISNLMATRWQMEIDQSQRAMLFDSIIFHSFVQNGQLEGYLLLHICQNPVWWGKDMHVCNSIYCLTISILSS